MRRKDFYSILNILRIAWRLINVRRMINVRFLGLKIGVIEVNSKFY